MELFSIEQFLQDPENNKNYEHGFWDWNCTDASLPKRSLSMAPKIKFLVAEGILDAKQCYVWMKNNAPSEGGNYDDFRISELYGKTFLGGFCPKDLPSGKTVVWYFVNGEFTQETFESWPAFKQLIKEDGKLTIRLKEAFTVREQ